MKRTVKVSTILWGLGVALLTATLVWAGTFTSYNDISTLQDTDELLLFDDSEGSGDQLANITIANFRASIGSLFSGDIDAGSYAADSIDSADYAAASIDNEHLADNAVGSDEIATDAVVMDGLDADGAFTSLTGAWATTGTLSGGSLAPVVDDCDNFAANFTGANLYGGTFVGTGAGTCQLPSVSGCVVSNFTIITIGATALVIDTNVSDLMVTDGVAGADGENITNLSTAGDIAVVQYYAASGWLVTTNGWTPE